MNIQHFNLLKSNFESTTGEDLWTSVEKYGLSLGFFFDNYEELIDFSSESEEQFLELIQGLKSIYKRKPYIVSDKRIIYALAISLFNTHHSRKRLKLEDTYVSNIFLTQDDAREILAHYGNFMSNPIAHILNGEKICYSLLEGRRLNQINVYVSNGKNNKPRIKGAYADKIQYSLLDIDYIHLDYYHPLVWHILKDKTIYQYEKLFPNAIKLCEKWITNSTQRLQKTNDE